MPWGNTPWALHAGTRHTLSIRALSFYKSLKCTHRNKSVPKPCSACAKSKFRRSDKWEALS